MAPSAPLSDRTPSRPVFRLAWLPLTAALLFCVVIWIGYTGFDAVVSETRQIVGQNLDSSNRISEIANHLQRINATLYQLMTVRAAGNEDINVPKRLEDLSKDMASLRTDLAQYRDRYASPSQSPSLTEALHSLENYQGAVNWVGSMLEIDFPSTVSFLKPFTALCDRLSQIFDDSRADAIAEARHRADQATQQANRAVLAFIAVTLTAALIVAAFAWLAGRYQQKLRVTADTLENLVAERTRELAQRSHDLEESLTNLREAQTKLVMQEKMASLGGLVAGVAHEINTPIGVALTGASMLLQETTDIRQRVADGKLRRSDFENFLALCADASALLMFNINRAADLVHSFKMVAADRTSDERRQVKLKTFLEEVTLSLGPVYRKLGHQVAVSCPETLEVDSYPGVLSQILSNLVTNSVVHGFENQEAGRILVTVRDRNDGMIEMVYTDNGRGIARESRARIFDPFFTTRRSSGSTGLGLHIVYNLVTARLGGEIRIDDTDGPGCHFTLTLPQSAPIPG